MIGRLRTRSGGLAIAACLALCTVATGARAGALFGNAVDFSLMPKTWLTFVTTKCTTALSVRYGPSLG